MARQLLWLPGLACLVAASAPRWPQGPSAPRFSWDTVPVFFHSQNGSGPFNDATIAFAGRFPLATVGGAHDHASNASNEAKILVEARRIKAASNDTKVIFYQNSVINFPQTRLHARTVANPALLLHDAAGAIVHCLSHAPRHNLTVFDLSRADVRAAWVDNARSVLRSGAGAVDGVFADRVGATLEHTFGVPGCNLSFPPGLAAAWNAGHLLLVQALQQAVSEETGGSGVAIANHVDADGVRGKMFENFKREQGVGYVPAGSQLAALVSAAAVHTVAEVHVDFCEYGSSVYNQTLAAFLLGAGNYSYYACTRGWSVQQGGGEWYPDYDRALGAPLGPATSVGGEGLVWYRRFASGTVAFLNSTDAPPSNSTNKAECWGTPCIVWADGEETDRNDGCAQLRQLEGRSNL